MHVPLVDLKAQYSDIQPFVQEAIDRVLNNASFILGKEVSAFEERFASYISTKYSVGIASGTSAINLALIACGVQPGDEVITTAHTFIATAEAISQIGAIPVFVDIDERTYNMDPNQLEDAITPRTRAILPVHLYGQAADMDPIMELAGRKGLMVVEDAAQAHGTEYKGRRCGSIGHLACFSFYPGKNLGAYGDAGAVTGSDEKLVNIVRMLRDHGRTSKYEHAEIGFGERIDALQAAVLAVKLNFLDKWTEARRAHAHAYSTMLSEIVHTPYQPGYTNSNFHLYVIRTEQRDNLLKFLRSKDIEAGIHYPIPLHRQPAYLKRGYGEVSLPITENIAGQILSLPLFPELSQDQLEYTVSCVKEYFGVQ